MTDLLASRVFDPSLDRLVELTRISSPSEDGEGLARAAGYLVEIFGEVGLRGRVEDREAEDGSSKPVLVAHSGSEGGGPRHLLVGHLDTVLPAREPERRGDRLVATGGIDMKGGLVALWGALRLLKERGGELPDDLTLVVVPDEEIGGSLTRGAMAEWGARAREVWVLEPGQLLDDGETLVSARRGLLQWHLDVRGRSAHAGNSYWEGRSALFAVATWCHLARQLAAPGDGPTVNAGRLVAGDSTFLDDLSSGANLLGTAHGVNVVADRARVDGEVRFLRSEDEERLRRNLDRITAEVEGTYGLDAELTISNAIPPLPPPRGVNRRLAERAVELAANRGWRLEIEKDRGGISFPNLLPDPGSLPVLDGLGPVGGGMHTREEWVSLESLRRRILLLADLLER